MNRDFKGVWIPKEIWLDEKLTWMEKLFLTEINSLDNENGCFASNKYFAEFFQLSNGRVSQIINSLIKKEYLSVKYDRNGKEIIKRVLRILNTGIKNIKQPIKNTKDGYLENAKDNNTSNNTSNNTLDKDVSNYESHVEKKKKKFAKPTIKELKEYINLKFPDAHFSAESFYSHYESNGWMVGKNKMVSWKASIKTWYYNNKDKKQSNNNITAENLKEKWRKERNENAKTV